MRGNTWCCTVNKATAITITTKAMASEDNLLDIGSERHYLTVDKRSLTSTSLDRHDLNGDDRHFESDTIRHASQLHRQKPVHDLDDDEEFYDALDDVSLGDDEDCSDGGVCSEKGEAEEAEADQDTKRVEREKKKSDVQEIIKIKEEHLRKLECMSSPQGPGFTHPPSILFDEVVELREELEKYRKFLTQKSICETTAVTTSATASATTSKLEEKQGEETDDDTDSSEASVTSSTYHDPPSTPILPTPPTPSTPKTSVSAIFPTPSTPKTGVSAGPMQGHFRAHLPKDQRTVIKCQPNQTLVDALRKKMSQRAFEIDLFSYVVYKKDTREPVEWDTDIATLNACEIVVELPSTEQNLNKTHKIVRKMIFRFTNCDICKRMLLSGFRCSQCGCRFHPKCSSLIPPHCTPASLDEAEEHFHKRLLAGNEIIGAAGLRPISDRDRSRSAPNVNLVGNGEANLELVTRAFEDRYKEKFESKSRKPEVSTISAGMIRQISGHKSNNSNNNNSVQSPSYNVMSAISQIISPIDVATAGGEAFKYPSEPMPSYTHVANPQRIALPESTGLNTTDALLHTPKHRNRSKSNTDGKPQHESRPKVTKRETIDEDWEINEDEVKFDVRIGSGSYGTVYKGFWHGTCALKMLNVKDPSPQQLQAFKNEAAVLRKTRHVNILLFMGCMSKKTLTIVTQWCDGASLYNHLHVRENEFSLNRIVEIARQTAQGVDYLHAKQIIHRDLKSNNIFLLEDFTVKVGDFGLATVKTRWSGEQGAECEQPSGSILWMAPEVIKMKDPQPYTFMSDVYAYGICLYELITSTLPYSNVSRHKDQLLWMIGRGFLKPDQSNIRSDCPRLLKKLFVDCSMYDRDERPSFMTILSTLDDIAARLPSISRSISDPSLYRGRLRNQVELCSYQTPYSPMTRAEFNQFNFNGK